MPVTSSFDILAEELGAVAGRIERESGLRIAAAISDLERRDAERELRITRLESLAMERLASIKDGNDGEPGAQGERGTDGKDGASGPPGEKGEPGEKGNPGTDGPAGKDGVAGVDGKNGEDGERGAPGENGRDGVDGIPGTNGTDGVPGLAGRDGLDGKDGGPGLAGKDGLDGNDGANGDRGQEGPAGKFSAPKAFRQGEVHYESDLVFHEGATWCAHRDTAQKPPHEDWAPVALKGVDAPVGEVRGLYDEKISYRKFDLVAFNGAEWRARKDCPGSLPGDGWAISAKQGKRGDKGERGDPGKEGKQGIPGPHVVERRVKGYVLVDTLSDGTTIACDLRSAFEEYHTEAS